MFKELEVISDDGDSRTVRAIGLVRVQSIFHDEDGHLMLSGWCWDSWSDSLMLAISHNLPCTADWNCECSDCTAGNEHLCDAKKCPCEECHYAELPYRYGEWGGMSQDITIPVSEDVARACPRFVLVLGQFDVAQEQSFYEHHGVSEKGDPYTEQTFGDPYGVLTPLRIDALRLVTPQPD